MTRAHSSTGEVLSIEQVPSGKMCKAYCVSCGDPLVAKKGDIKVHHFSHDHQQNCTWRPETELHILAKEYFKDAQTIELPIGLDQPVMRSFSIVKPRLEETIAQSGYRPDIAAEVLDESIWFEIAVSHSCEQEKIVFFRNRRMNVLEFDFSSFEV